MEAGQYVGPYQLQASAPVGFIRASRTRAINGRLVTGSWSDPWWAYSPEHGWAIVRRWKNQERAETRWSAYVPAMDTLVVSAVGPDNSLGDEMDLAA